ncbi:MAG: MATE family efflux transporter [Gammaproteobacteria bacterium]
MEKFFKEAKKFLKLGIPIYGSQLSYGAIQLTDTIIAGRAGAQELAGVALASSLATPLFFSLSGIMFALTPIVAHLFGARKIKNIRSKMRQSIWIAVGIGTILTVAYYFASNLLIFSNIDSEIVSISDSYLKGLAIGAIAMMWFTCLRCFSEGVTQTLPVFWVAFIAMILNIPLDIILVYGYLGFPKLGGAGCGYATSIIYIFMATAMTIIIMLKQFYTELRFFNKFEIPSIQTFKELMFLGMPIGIGIFVELSMFSGAALILGPLGDIVLASHSIALSIASMAFMLPLSIGLAAAARVGNLIGEQKIEGAKYASKLAITITLFAAGVNTIAIILLDEWIVSFFSTETMVVNTALSLLVLAAVFQLPDGFQMGVLGSLRGYKDTFIPMILLMISYWVFALPAGYFLTYIGFHEPMGARGVWVGMIVGLTIFSALAITRLKYVISLSLKQT